jgi:uncharacterized protein YjiS (DUF1127 family)
MRPYYFDFHLARTRRAMAVVGFERAMRSGSPPPRRRPASDYVEAVLTLLRCWRERVRRRQELVRLDRRLLRDVGITAAEAERECGKPFWRA